MLLPIKYSMIAARLFPIHDTRIPTNGPKIAPFSMTMGSVGMGVADNIPISNIEKSGPAMPVVGMYFSTDFKSLAKYMIKAMGTMKVIRAMVMFNSLPYFFIK